MKESKYHDTIETLRILVNIRNLSEWFRINYVSKFFISSILVINIFERRQQMLDVYAAYNCFDKKVFLVALQKWINEKSSMLLFHSSNMAVYTRMQSRLSPNQYTMLISSKGFAPDIRFLNLGVVSLRLSWNISRKTESELSYNELLDVLSELVLKLSGEDTWNCGTPHIPPFKQCSKWYFLPRCAVIVNILYETLRCILSLGENVQAVFQVSTRHTRRIQ